MAARDQERIWPFDYEPSDAEAAGMYRFLLAIVALEDAIGLALRKYWRSSRPEFYTTFIQDMAASKRLAQLETCYPSFQAGVSEIRGLYQIRNALAHRLPEATVENDGDPVVTATGLEIQPVRPVGRIRQKNGPVRALDSLTDHTTRSNALKREVERLKSPLPRRA